MEYRYFTSKLNLAFLAIGVLIFTACSSEQKKIDEINKNLESQKEWVTKYTYHFDEIDGSLIVIETSKFKNGKFTQIQTFFDNSGLDLFQVTSRGTYEVIYESDLSSFFLDQEYDDNPKVENLNTKEAWFDKLELEFRVDYFGDAYDVVKYNKDDDDTLYGVEIIECATDHLILKDLEDMEIYKYIPGDMSTMYNKNFK